MEITLIQAVLIGLWTAFCWSGMLLGIYTNRALFLSFGVGIILGDLPTALAVGAVAELAFMGFGVGPGGTVPPNPIGPGIVGTIMAITMDGISPEAALALSIPFAVAIQFLQTLVYTLAAGLPEGAGRALEKKSFKKWSALTNTTVLLFAVFGFILGFMAAFAQPQLNAVVSAIPAWLSAGLKVAGGMLPAIGFAMILSVMLSKELAPVAILGYVASAYLQLPVIGITLVGLIFALKYYYDAKKQKELAPAPAADEAHDDWI